MKLLFKNSSALLLMLGAVMAVYLLPPGPRFPQQIPGSLKSNEPADIEDPLRQGFYSDWDRTKIMGYFKDKFSKSSWLDLPLLTERINYPPEEAQTIIRDQTKSQYLEEFVHPLRESLFVNGFFAQKDTEVMIVNGHQYKTKVIVRMVPSNSVFRTIIGLAGLFMGLIAVTNFLRGVKEIKNA